MSDDPDCLGMCAIDGEVCTGCGRTLDDINAARDAASAVPVQKPQPPQDQTTPSDAVPSAD